MSEPERQERITETLALLGRLAPAELQTDRDELFFRAGEASARGEQTASSFRRRFAWPAIAATLALLATGLGYFIVSQQPELQIVYVERPEGQTSDRAEERALPVDSVADQTPTSSFNSRETRGDLLRNPRSDIIHPQDWAALSDAFAQQLRLQYEEGATLAGDLRQDDTPAVDDAPRPQPRTYLELRDSLRAL